ncbi:metallophosphoesterase family protein [Modestobacter muralis]|uniref:hypothetical protein n=1 Tax=Modestobacter muralis TaxID=1608614 RepID=UPI001FE3D051|nr:hypothetical protein [Modestobacter muralis]
MALLHAYLWWRLVRGTTTPGRTRRRLTLLLAGLGLLVVLTVVLSGQVPLAVATPLNWVGYSWLGLAFYLFLAVLVTEPVRLVARVVQAVRRRRGPAVAAPVAVTSPAVAPVAAEPAAVAPAGSSAVPDPGRRLFLARTLAVGAGAVAVGTAGAGAVSANSAPVVRRIPIHLPRLDPALAGFRIVTFSDGHLPATYGGRRFERVVETVNAQRPDVVAIVGDLVDDSVEELREDVAPLGDLVS